MPRDDSTAVVKVQARGLRKAEKMVQIQQKYIRGEIQETIEEVGLVTTFILQGNAPERTGRLKESIMVTGHNRSAFRPSVRVGVVGAISDDGFPYLNVTRFGRRAVEASKQRPNFRPEAGIGSARMARTYNWKSKDDTGAQKRPFRGHMLRFEPGPPGTGFIYKRRVKAYRPKRDWIRQSEGEIAEMSDYAFAQLTNKIEDILTTGSAPRKTTVLVKSRFGKFS